MNLSLSKGHTALRVVTAVWAAASMIQITIWVLMVAISGNLVTPWWWMGNVAAGGVVIGVLWRIAGTGRRDRQGPGAP